MKSKRIAIKLSACTDEGELLESATIVVECNLEACFHSAGNQRAAAVGAREAAEVFTEALRTAFVRAHGEGS